MEPISTSHAVGEVIQLALAPVFLLVALGSFLNVVTQRLARAIDRARALEALYIANPDSSESLCTSTGLIALDRRIAHSQWAINFCGASALLTALLVMILFLTDLVAFDAGTAIAVLFCLALGALILALGAFMVEIFIATRTIRVRTDLLKR